ncbi:hypothetical protein DL98DRAFT_512771 [Cadophora sp. DSE1049]|nr:hypothetical protein DL98DRAFT_512771 [Cadophora sp. DSE1049]
MPRPTQHRHNDPNFAISTVRLYVAVVENTVVITDIFFSAVILSVLLSLQVLSPPVLIHQFLSDILCQEQAIRTHSQRHGARAP